MKMSPEVQDEVLRQLKLIFPDQKFICLMFEPDGVHVHKFAEVDDQSIEMFYRWFKQMEAGL